MAAAGEGESSPGALSNDYGLMKTRAEEAAQKAASVNALLLLLLYPCPRCRMRSAKAFFIKLAVATVGLVALAVSCAFLLLEKKPEWAGAIVCAVSAIIVLSYMIDRLWLMGTVTKYIAFHPTPVALAEGSRAEHQNRDLTKSNPDPARQRPMPQKARRMWPILIVMLVVALCTITVILITVLARPPRNEFAEWAETKQKAEEGRMARLRARLDGKREALSLEAKVACDMIDEYVHEVGPHGQQLNYASVSCDGMLTMTDRRAQLADVRITEGGTNFTVTACFDRRSRWYVLDVIDAGSCADLPSPMFSPPAAQRTEADFKADEQDARDEVAITAFKSKLLRIKAHIEAERGTEKRCSRADLTKYLLGDQGRHVVTFDATPENAGDEGKRWRFLQNPVISKIVDDAAMLAARGNEARALKGPGGALLLAIKGEQMVWPVTRSGHTYDAGSFTGLLFVFNLDTAERLCQATLTFRNSSVVSGYPSEASALQDDLVRNYEKAATGALEGAAPGLILAPRRGQ